MISSLDEKCLLKFLSGNSEKEFGLNSNIINLLKKFNIDVKIQNPNELYDIIEEYENN